MASYQESCNLIDRASKKTLRFEGFIDFTSCLKSMAYILLRCSWRKDVGASYPNGTCILGLTIAHFSEGIPGSPSASVDR